MVFPCSNIHAHYNEAVLCLNFGTPENNGFSIWNKWKIYYFLVSQYLSTLGFIVCDFAFPSVSLGALSIANPNYASFRTITVVSLVVQFF